MKDNDRKVDEQKINFVEDEQDTIDDGIWLKVYESAGLAKRFANKQN